MKRVFDLAMALIFIVMLSPLFIIIIILVKLWGGTGPVLFKQKRAGKTGIPFTILKFRTMVQDAENMGAGLEIETNDFRITRIGRFLRKTSLDELPQFWNVIRGDMSLVGPRPLPMEYISRYNRRQKRRLEVKPGITGYTQVKGRNTWSWQEKLEGDVFYIENRSVRWDLVILFLTIYKILKREGITDDSGEVREFTGSSSSEGENRG